MRQLYLTVLSLATLRVWLKQRDFGQDPLGVPGAIGRLGQFGWDRELGIVARQEVPEHGIGLVDGSGAS